MKYIFTLLVFLAFWSCSEKANTELLSGDLYFGVFRIGSYYNQPDSIVIGFETYFDTTNLDTSNPNERLILSQYSKLKEYDLLYKPFVNLLINEDSVVNLYLTVDDYNKIKIYKRKDLQEENKKVHIKSMVQKIDSGLYNSIELKKIEVVEGLTKPKQGKLKIEDYY